MKCSTCTTELWGRPAICPVCGTPTGLVKRSSRQTPPPWSKAPEDAPPSQSQQQMSSFFNASDLLDQDVFDALPQAPQAPEPADLFLVAPAPENLTKAEPPRQAPVPEPGQGLLNAADLFDPAVLAGLTGSAVEERGSFPNTPEAPAYEEERDTGYPDERNSYPPAPGRPTKGQRSIPRFTLSTLPDAPPEPTAPPPPAPVLPFRSQPITPRPSMPPPPPAPAFPFPGPPIAPEPTAPPPMERTLRPQRSYNIVSGPAPLGPYPMPGSAVGPYPMPAPPYQGRAPRGGSGRRFLGTLGGMISLLVVLAIIGVALFFGATRYFQLEALLPKPAQTTVPTLPVVAPKPGYTIYPNHSLNFSLQYANDWKPIADHDPADAQYQGIFFQAGLYTGLEVGTSPAYSSENPSQMDNDVLNNPFPIKDIVSNQPSNSTSPTVHIINQDWTVEDADLVLTNGVALRITCLAIQHNGRGYIIFYFARQEVFSSNYTQYFQPMLLSFRFLDG